MATTDLGDRPVLGRVRRRDWERLSHGLHLPLRTRTLAEELAAWQLVLPPTAAFSHLTSAELRGWWLPAGVAHPVFAALCTSGGGPGRSGLLVCRHPKPVGINVIDGLRVTTPAETLLAAARDLGVLDLVPMADSALRRKDCTLTDIKIAASQHRRGAPLLRSVVPLLDARSESPWESIMRVLHVAAEIPVTPQYEILDHRGRFVARGDLRIDGTQRIHEYDGADHRDGEVHADDLVRDRKVLTAGWERHGFVSRHLLRDGASIIADVDRLLGRPWEPRRLDAWNHLVANSLYGRPGRARAWDHWRRAMS